jgi:hypothetical protein
VYFVNTSFSMFTFTVQGQLYYFKHRKNNTDIIIYIYIYYYFCVYTQLDGNH